MEQQNNKNIQRSLYNNKGKNQNPPSTIIRGEKTNIKALASEAVDKLTRHISKAMPIGNIQIGAVEAISEGPPTTLTVNLNGQSVSSIRFLSTGVTPAVADLVVVYVHGTRYVCVGVLA